MDLLARIDAVRDEIITSTQELVRIKSVEDVAKPGMPFGQGINDCLEYCLHLATKLGFRTKNFDGFVGHAEMGQGEEILGILVHLDVVPEGSNWTYPPYGAEIHDGKIYGRGAIDDKGPTIAALYAAKAVMDSGLPINKRVRIIFGTDEESGWNDMKHYMAHEELPHLGFAPDAEFPAIHGEKGILVFSLEKKFETACGCCEGTILKSVKGGNAPNMVPDYCEAVISGGDLAIAKAIFDNYVAKNKVHLVWEAKGPTEALIKSYGISSHGSLPEHGVNAVSQMLLALSKMVFKSTSVNEFLKDYAEKIGLEYNGQSIGCALTDEVSGKLVFNVGLIDLTEEGVNIVVNIRYPVTKNAVEVFTGMRKALQGTGIVVTEKSDSKPLYVPIDDELVVKLMKVYQEITGDSRPPITIGGGTYARAIKKAVAFGPLFPGQPELAHQRDEFMGVEDLILNAKIYAKAIAALVE